MDKITHLIAGFIILSFIFAVLESLFAANKTQKVFRSGYKTDLVYWFFTPIVFKTITLVAMVIVFSILFHTPPKMLKSVIEHRETWITAHLAPGTQLLLMAVVGDFIGYWTHRWFHSRRLWKFHAVHHCSEELDWLSSVRLHPVNELLSKLIQAAVLLGLGFNPKGVAVYVPFLAFYALLLHANVTWGFGWLGYIIASPRFHRWHHTSQEEGLDKNFAGLFPWIDRIFGTYYMPKDRLPEKFGLYGEKIPDSFWGQMMYPFRKKKKKAAA
ncbi:MAG: sterol desaturase family protein [Alphaproteobacteria bacterium]|nr:MAG: sterol desaturase family protein [Alphaproteobacteria bacterium]